MVIADYKMYFDVDDRMYIFECMKIFALENNCSKNRKLNNDHFCHGYVIMQISNGHDFQITFGFLIMYECYKIFMFMF